MLKYRHAARRNAWDPYDNGLPNYNPFALRHLAKRVVQGDEEDPELQLRPRLGLLNLDLPVSSSQEEEDPRVSTRPNSNGKDEPVDNISVHAQSDHAPDAEPAHILDACLAPVPDGQPASVVPSHKRPLKGNFGTRGKNKASRKIAEIGLAFIEHGAIAITGPVGQNPLIHQRSIIFVEYGSRDPLASGK